MNSEIYYCGELVSADGLEPIARLLEPCSWGIRLMRSGYDGTFYLRAHHPDLDLYMDSGQGPSFLFSGIIDGVSEDALYLLGELSALLSGGDVIHRIESYCGGPSGEMIGYFHHHWPQGG